MRLALAAAFALIALPALAQPDLVGTTFTLVDLNGTPVAGEDPATLVFGADGGVGGNGGCNTYGGSVAFEGDDGLVFGEIVSTLVACGEPAMSEETGWYDALAETTHYHVSGGTLFLLDDDGNKLATLQSAQ